MPIELFIVGEFCIPCIDLECHKELDDTPGKAGADMLDGPPKFPVVIVPFMPSSIVVLLLDWRQD